MALPLHQILTRPTYIQPTRVIIKRCGNPRCNSIISSHDGFEYLHSSLNDKFYCDAVCLARSEGVEIDWFNRRHINLFLEEMEAELKG